MFIEIEKERFKGKAVHIFSFLQKNDKPWYW